MNFVQRALLAAVAGSAALTLLSGCGGSSDSQAYVRLVNATSDYSSLDLYSSSTLLTSDTASYSVGNYYGLAGGDYTLNLVGPDSTATAASASVTVSANAHYAIVGYVNGGSLKTATLTEDEATPTSGTAKIRIFNAAYSNVGSVDTYLTTGECSALSSSTAAAISSSLAGTSAYISVTAASAGTSYHLCVTAAGDKTDLRLDVPSLTLTSQQITTLILSNTSGGVLLNGVLLQQQSSLTQALNTSARMRLAVGAASSAAVSATVNDVSLGSNLTAPAVGNYKLVTAGALTANITVGGTAVATSGLSVAAGADATLLVNGTAASTPVLIADDNSVSTSTNYPVKLRLVNGLNGTSGTATLTDDYVTIGDGANTGSATAYSQVSASSAAARIESTYGSTQLCLSTDVTLSSGHVYSVFLLGDVPSAATTCTIRVDR